MKYFFDSLQMTFAPDAGGRLYVPRVDKPDEIERSPERIAAARELGRRLVEE